MARADNTDKNSTDDFHCVIGTGGHIDHGKTVLVKVLTGVDTDRLSEEKKRGISIDLGFAPLVLPSGAKASIVDLPGHEKFLKNMLAGATGIDLLLLVVAADDGIMPQTVEHLQIAELLEINKAVVAMSKIDTVDYRRQTEVKSDIYELLKTTRFRGAPIVATSAIQKLGLKELLVELDKASTALPDKSTELPWRLPIDRVFTIKGAGTVVTGTLWSGEINHSAAAEILPGDKAVRIRGLQVHNRSTDKVQSGRRVAVNLAGVTKSEIARGDMLAEAGYYHSTQRVDATVKLLASAGKELKTGAKVRFYHGTKETLATIRLFDSRLLKAGAADFARINLGKPIIAYYRDHFIIRFPNSPRIIGGGTIIDSCAQTTTRRDIKKTIAELEILALGNSQEIITLIMKRNKSAPLTMRELSKSAELADAEVSRTIDKLLDEKLLKVFSYKDLNYYLLQDDFKRAHKEVLEYLAAWHRQNPLLAGVDKDRLSVDVFPGLTAKKAGLLLIVIKSSGKISISRDHISLAEFSLKDNQKVLAGLDKIRAFLAKRPYSPPKIKEMDSYLEVSGKESRSLVNTMRANGEIIIIGDYVFLATAIAAAQERLVSYLKQNKDITVSDWRQLLNTSRKYALPLLEYFDKQGVTVRDGNVRLLKNEYS